MAQGDCGIWSLTLSTNGGSTWSPALVGLATNRSPFMVSTNGAQLFVGTEVDNYISHDSGLTWSNTGTPPHFGGGYGTALSSDGFRLAILPLFRPLLDLNFLTSVDGGRSWTWQYNAGQRRWTSISSSSNGLRLAAAAYGDYIYTSVDGGISWSPRMPSLKPPPPRPPPPKLVVTMVLASLFVSFHA
jgi:photosystem II stability/assembly factor-like uncharacterized protein